MKEERFLNLNSKFRDTPDLSTSSDFQMTIACEIPRVVEMEIDNIQIPSYAYYTISKAQKNYIFWAQVNTTKNPTAMQEITIPEGNYSPEELSIYLNTTYFYLSSTSSSNPFRNIKFNIDANSMKATFSVITSAIKQYFSVVFYDLTLGINVINSFGFNMGFLSPIYTYCTTINDYDKILLQSENAASLFASRCIYLSIDDYQYNNKNNNSAILLNNSQMDDHIMAKVIIPESPYNELYNMNSKIQLFSFNRVYRGPITLKRLRVKMYDENGVVIYLNGIDINFTLKLKIATT